MTSARHQEPNSSFAEGFAKVAGELPPLPGDLRTEAFCRFQSTGIPTNRVEAWKFTNVARYANLPLVPASSPQVTINDVMPLFAGGPPARRLIFINGHYSSDLSHALNPPVGVRIEPLHELLDEPGVLERIRELRDERSFTDLNTAMLNSGAVIDVAPGVRVEDPIQLVFLSVAQGSAVMSHPRILVHLGKGARLHLIESHGAVRDGHCLTNLISQIEIGEEAELVHDRLQRLHDGNTLISKSDISIGGKGKLHQTLVSLGGSLIRNESEVRLKGSEIDATLNGTFMPTAREHVDNLIRMHHEKPDCESNQFYKGVMDGHGRGVFSGKIIVHEDAQRTNAFQTNNNLLLSDDAEIDSKPELEIYADDVKCSHGATCGDHDEASLFYLRSRGLDRATAESIMTYAFAGEIVELLRDEELKRIAKQAIFQRLPGGESLMEML